MQGALISLDSREYTQTSYGETSAKCTLTKFQKTTEHARRVFHLHQLGGGGLYRQWKALIYPTI